MTQRQPAEVRDLVDKLLSDFQSLRTDGEFLSRILHGRHAPDLLGDLEAMKFRRPAPSPSGSAVRWAQDAERALGGDLVMRALVRQPRWSGRADKLEVQAAWVRNQIDPGGRFLQAVKQALVRAPFCAVWEYLRPFRPPADKEAFEEYMGEWFPLYCEVDPGMQSGFLEDGGVVTMAVRCVEKSIYEVVRDYGKGKSKSRNALEIWDEEFPHLRAGYGTDKWSARERGSGKKIVTYEVDDGDNRAHYVEMPSEGRRLYPISSQKDDAPWVNPIGRPMVRFGSGAYNSTASDIRDRYQPWLRAVLLKTYDVDLQQSMLNSWAPSRNDLFLELPPEVLKELAEFNSVAEKEHFLDQIMVREGGGIIKALGKVKELELPIPASLALSLQYNREELQSFLPRQNLSEMTIRETTATALSMVNQQENEQYFDVRHALTQIVHDVVEDVFDLMRVSDRSYVKNTPSASSKVAIYGLTSGTEKTKSQEVKAGQKLQLGPDELGEDGNWYQLEVDYLDTRAPAVNARRADANEMYQAGAIDQEQWLEKLDFTNATEQRKRLEAQAREQKMIAALDGIAMTRALALVEMETGLPAQALLQAVGGVGMEQAAGPAPPATQNGNQTYQVAPPRVDEQPVGVTG